MVSQVFKSLGDFTQMAAEAVPSWITFGWPSESAWKGAGSPSLAYTEWQKVQQPFSAGAQASVYTNPVLAPAVDAPPPIAFEAPPEFVSGATAATSRLNSPAIEPAPLAPVDPGAVIPNFLQGVNQALSPEGAQAGYGFAPQAAAPPPGLLEKALGVAGDVVGIAGDIPLANLAESVPVVGSPLSALLKTQDAATRNPATLGEAAAWSVDERGNPVSRFIADEIRPRAADAGQVAGDLFGQTPAGLGLNAGLSAIGAAGGPKLDSGDIGRAVGEYGTPVSPLDLILSLVVPATSDPMDVYRILKGSSLFDDAGRFLPGVTRSQVDNVLRQFGKTVDDLPELPIGAADALVRGTPVDQGTDAARLLSGPGAGREIPAPRPGIGGAGDEALTQAERDALDSYQGLGYAEVNRNLRSGVVDDTAQALDSALSKSAPLTTPTTVQRGLARQAVPEGGFKPGVIINEQGFQSFTTDADIATRYARRGEGPVLEVTLPEGTRALSTWRAGETGDAAGELILPRGTRLRVTSVTPDKVTAELADEVPAGRAAPPVGTAAEVPPSGAATSAAPAYYHETSPQRALQWLQEGTIPKSGPMGQERVFMANTPDLALGQGGKGAVIEFDPAKVTARANPKPGQPESFARELGGEFVSESAEPGAVRSITIKADAQLTPEFEQALTRGEQYGNFTVTRNADGSRTVASASPWGGAGSPPRGPATAVADVPPGGVPPTGAAGGATPSDPVAKLTDIIDQARPLPAQTEELRKVERSQRIAQSSRILEEGGFSGDAFQQAKGPLAGEYSRAAFDPPNVNFQPEEIQQFRNMIGESDLRTFDKINVNTALDAVLEGRLNEIRPFEIGLLDKVYGSKFSLAVAMKAAPPSFADKVYEWWLSSILSGPMTQMRNIVGNTAAAMTAPVERLGAAALDPFVARATGRQTERFWQEAPEQVIGMIHGIPEGVTGALKAMRGGFAESALTESASRAPAIGGLKGRIIRAPLTMLEVMDSFFGAVNYEGAYRALAVRMARSEGLTGQALQVRIADLLANRTDDLIDAATQEKLLRLFRDEPTRVGQAIMSARNTYKPLRFLVPFARTPDRLLAYGIKRSPLGLLDFPMWQRLAKGNPAAVDELAQTMMGSTVAMALGALVANGQLDITGAFPTNAAARDRLYREGKQPFSVKMPGIGWVQYSQIPGLDTALTTLASAKESFESGEGIDKAVGDLGASIAANIFDRSYVSGLADFMEIFSGGGYEDPADAAMRWVGRQASGAIPYGAFSRQTAQFFDQTVYKPQGIAENVATGIGLAGPAGVPERQTAFGETSSRAFPSPISISPDRQSAVDAELEKAGVEIGFTGKSIAGVGLTREQQTLYQTAAGQLTYQALDAIVQSPSYQALSTGDKIKVLEKARDKARDMVRDPINKLVDSEGWKTLTPEQQKQVIDAALKRDPQEMLQLMGR